MFTSGTVKVFAIKKFSEVKFSCNKCQAFIEHLISYYVIDFINC